MRASAPCPEDQEISIPGGFVIKGNWQHLRATRALAQVLVSFLFDLMSIETLGEARDGGMNITARCAWGRREGLKSIRECKASFRLDLETLIWTRGAAFPISMLEGRLKCPRCGSRRVVLLFDLPGNPAARRA
jgi:DNA-directed RNA polymerase subunit RPC12/RpoP